MINVAIAEDQAGLREAFVRLINNFHRMTVTITAVDGIDLLDQLAAAEVLPDVLLLDINMPRMDGVEASSVMRERFASVRVVVFTSWGGDDFRVKRMMENGCVGYLEKDALPGRVEEVLRESVATGSVGERAVKRANGIRE